MEVPKRERLQEVYRRLAAAPPATSFAEMRRQLDAILNEVEDQLTGIPYDASSWVIDGRLYPVQDDHVHDVEGHPGVTLLRARRNEIFIGANGSIEIRNAASRAVEFSRCGADGRGVWELA
jgi:hypothetical protein